MSRGQGLLEFVRPAGLPCFFLHGRLQQCFFSPLLLLRGLDRLLGLQHRLV